jgi:hypothetical protein
MEFLHLIALDTALNTSALVTHNISACFWLIVNSIDAIGCAALTLTSDTSSMEYK